MPRKTSVSHSDWDSHLQQAGSILSVSELGFEPKGVMKHLGNIVVKILTAQQRI